MAAAEAPIGTGRRLLPLGDPSRGRRLIKIAVWLVAIGLIVALLELLGVDVGE